MAKNLTTKELKTKLTPWFITGFSDGESSFTVLICKKQNTPTGWVVQPSFEVGLHHRDLNLIKEIKKFFLNIGSITINKKKFLLFTEYIWLKI
jgi:hypothetical protein